LLRDSMRFRPVFLAYFCSQLLDEDIPPADFATVHLELDRAGLWKGVLFSGSPGTTAGADSAQ